MSTNVAIRVKASPVEMGGVRIKRMEFNIPFEHNGMWHHLVAPILFLIVVWVKFKKLVYRRLFNTQPLANTIWYDGMGNLTRVIKENASKWRSMDALYNYYEQVDGKGSISRLTDFLWVGKFGNAKAVRNRFRIVREWLNNSFVEVGKQTDSIRVASIACGSAQAVLEAVSIASKQGINIQVLLIDQDQESLDYALKIAEKLGIAELVSISKVNVLRAGSRLKAFAPNIVEMVGLADYFDDRMLLNYLTQVNKNIPAGAKFLTANIVDGQRLFHKAERAFLHNVVDWPPMVYRTPKNLANIVSSAGFSDVTSSNEPLGIYCLVEGVKAEMV
jgi:hypothetical protein